MCDTKIRLTKSIKNFLIVVFSMVAFALLSSGCIVHADKSGNCGKQGDNVQWTLTDAGKLTISGKGEMADYSILDDNSAPWYENSEEVKAVEIEEGVTSIGDCAFVNCSNLTKVNIPDTVQKIGQVAFAGAEQLQSVKIPEKVSEIKMETFEGCAGLTTVTIPNTVETIGERAFMDCENIKTINLPKSSAIGESAFSDCKNLKFLSLGATLYKEATQNREFYGIPESTRVFFVAADGTTSTTIDKKGIIWLKEESGGTSAWYGIDNSKGQFDIGSKFWVRWLSKKQNPEEWQEAYKKLDKEHKEKLTEDDHMWIFQIGVAKITEDDGEELELELSHFSLLTDLYIQLGDDWEDTKENQVVYISTDIDEKCPTERIENFKFPDGTIGTAAKATLSHFSRYAVYESSKTADTSGKSEGASSEKLPSFIDSVADEIYVDDARSTAKSLASMIESLESKKNDTSGKSEDASSDNISGSSEGAASTGSSYFSKTADTIMPQTLYVLAALLMLSLAGLWVSLKKQRA